MAALSKEFADDPCSKTKRQQMIVAARALLTSVTQLLILADLVDVQLILKSIRLVRERRLTCLRFSSCIVRFFAGRRRFAAHPRCFQPRRVGAFLQAIRQEHHRFKPTRSATPTGSFVDRSSVSVAHSRRTWSIDSSKRISLPHVARSSAHR